MTDSNTNPNVNKYIVELFKWIPTTNSYKPVDSGDSCTMTLNTLSGVLNIDHHVLVNVLNDNFAIISRNRYNAPSSTYIISDHELVPKLIAIDYEMMYNNQRFGVRFCNRSSASATDFNEKYDKLRSQYRFIERYPSGRIKLEGSKTNKGATGICIEYYDKVMSPIKYVGEFDDGTYDGAGEFFSVDGNIHLICKNICNGVPNGKGFLRIGRDKVRQPIEMKDFKNFKSTSATYTNDIYATIESDYSTIMEQVHFESLSLDDKLTHLFNEVQTLKKFMNNNTTTTTSLKSSVLNYFY